MLGAQHNPFETVADPNAPNFKVPNLNLAQGLTLAQPGRSPVAWSSISTLCGRISTNTPASRPWTVFAGSVRVRQRPGGPAGVRHQQGRPQTARPVWPAQLGPEQLLARRLVEAGSTFVTVHFGGWDHHWDLKKGYENYLPIVDTAVSALFQDLDDRGLLGTTLVVLCGEFSRTPKMNDGGNGGKPRSMGTPGRDHWGNSMFCLMGGGGVKGGQIVGSTDRLGERPKDAP